MEAEEDTQKLAAERRRTPKKRSATAEIGLCKPLLWVLVALGDAYLGAAQKRRSQRFVIFVISSNDRWEIDPM